jgi:hypothetical protein
MERKLKFTYDSVGDILLIDVCERYLDQDEDEIDDGVVARFNPVTGEIENIDILFFNARVKANPCMELPVRTGMRLIEE